MSSLGLYVEPHTNNIGIGTTTPAQKLHVVGDARIQGNLTVNGKHTIIDTNTSTSEQIIITNDGTGPALVVNQTGNQPIIDIQDEGFSVLRIADGGNVGIGTANPRAKLHINDTGAMIIPAGTTAQIPSIAILGMLRYNTDTGRLQFYNQSGWSSIGGVSAIGGNSILESNGYRIHIFTSSENFTVVSGGEVEYLVVAGGGSGGTRTSDSAGGGGGGAGGVLQGAQNLNVGNYVIVIGNGGIPQTSDIASGIQGNDSSAIGVIAIGGGAGGKYGGGGNGGNGGSGGGAGRDSNNIGGVGIAGPPRQGFDGGSGGNNPTGSGGGGGAGAAGTIGNSSGGQGGAGVSSSITGSSVTYAGGGGGASFGGIVANNGGAGGGGRGGTEGPTVLPLSGTNGLGGGGGGGVTPSGGGGSGIVIIRYRL